MATKKIPTVEQLDELAKNLNFQDLFLHYKNLSIILEDQKKKLTDVQMDAQFKLEQLKDLS